MRLVHYDGLVVIHAISLGIDPNVTIYCYFKIHFLLISYFLNKTR